MEELDEITGKEPSLQRLQAEGKLTPNGERILRSLTLLEQAVMQSVSTEEASQEQLQSKTSDS